ncbi:MAG: hypothetical protein Q7U66_11660 [Methylobacter sp.]|nr:hypothetical protein [Methylobacter sp.]
MPVPIMFKASFACMDVGKGREHDCTDAGGRATQEQLPRSGSFELRSHFPWSPKLALDIQDWLYD